MGPGHASWSAGLCGWDAGAGNRSQESSHHRFGRYQLALRNQSWGQRLAPADGKPIAENTARNSVDDAATSESSCDGGKGETGDGMRQQTSVVPNWRHPCPTTGTSAGERRRDEHHVPYDEQERTV